MKKNIMKKITKNKRFDSELTWYIGVLGGSVDKVIVFSTGGPGYTLPIQALNFSALLQFGARKKGRRGLGSGGLTIVFNIKFTCAELEKTGQILGLRPCLTEHFKFLPVTSWTLGSGGLTIVYRINFHPMEFMCEIFHIWGIQEILGTKFDPGATLHCLF